MGLNFPKNQTFPFWTLGCLLFYAIIVYHHKLNKGQYVYYVNYKMKWIAFTVYLTIALFLTCGEYPPHPRALKERQGPVNIQGEE